MLRMIMINRYKILRRKSVLSLREMNMNLKLKVRTIRKTVKANISHKKVKAINQLRRFKNKNQKLISKIKILNKFYQIRRKKMNKSKKLRNSLNWKKK